MRRTGQVQGAAQQQFSAARSMGRSVLAGLILSITTSPWQPPAGLGRSVVDHIQNLELSGWAVRQSYVRNYLLWRNDARQRSGRPTLVLPFFSERAPRQVMAMLVLADLLAAERRTAPSRTMSSLVERQTALCLRETGLTPAELDDLAEGLLVTAIVNNWLL